MLANPSVGLVLIVRSLAGLSDRAAPSTGVQVSRAALTCSRQVPFDRTTAVGPSPTAALLASTIVEPWTPSRSTVPTWTDTVLVAVHARSEQCWASAGEAASSSRLAMLSDGRVG